jgi:hypothetical protein
MVVSRRKRTRSKSAPLPKRVNVPAQDNVSAPVQASGGNSLLDSLKHGLGVGTGIEVSRQIIQGITSHDTKEPVTPNNTPESKNCQLVYENMMSCIHDKDVESCDLYIQNYRDCASQQ